MVILNWSTVTSLTQSANNSLFEKRNNNLLFPLTISENAAFGCIDQKFVHYSPYTIILSMIMLKMLQLPTWTWDRRWRARTGGRKWSQCTGSAVCWMCPGWRTLGLTRWQEAPVGRDCEHCVVRDAVTRSQHRSSTILSVNISHPYTFQTNSFHWTTMIILYIYHPAPLLSVPARCGAVAGREQLFSVPGDVIICSVSNEFWKCFQPWRN